MMSLLEGKAVKKEFIVTKNGKEFVLYAGILDLAHQQGLKAIRTNMLQAPTEANNRMAIVEAIVTLEQDGVERVFSGIGDAAPNNVAPAMANCLLRMAETRAKARALRDAVNIGTAAFEEMGATDDSDGQPAAPRAARASTRTAVVPASRPGACPHCPVSNAEKGNHHRPDCPNRTAERAARG